MPFPAAQIVAQLLIDRGIGSAPGGVNPIWPVTVGNLPPNEPHNALMVMDTGAYLEGRIARTGERVEKPTVILTTRASNYGDGLAKSQAVESFFDSIIPAMTGGFPVTTVGAEDYELLAAHVTIPTVKIAREEQARRDLFTMNARLTLRPVTYYAEDAGGDFLAAAEDNVAVTYTGGGVIPYTVYGLDFSQAVNSMYVGTQ